MMSLSLSNEYNPFKTVIKELYLSETLMISAVRVQSCFVLGVIKSLANSVQLRVFLTCQST